MIGLWIAAGFLTLAVLALLLMPLLRKRSVAAPERADYDLSVYREQLAEIDRDLERDLMTAEQADAARIEIKRRMLAAADTRDHATPRTASPRLAWGSAVTMVIAVPLVAFALYWSLGAPQTPDLPWASRPEPAAHAETKAREGARPRKSPKPSLGWRNGCRPNLRIATAGRCWGVRTCPWNDTTTQQTPFKRRWR